MAVSLSLPESATKQQLQGREGNHVPSEQCLHPDKFLKADVWEAAQATAPSFTQQEQFDPGWPSFLWQICEGGSHFPKMQWFIQG